MEWPQLVAIFQGEGWLAVRSGKPVVGRRRGAGTDTGSSPA